MIEQGFCMEGTIDRGVTWRQDVAAWLGQPAGAIGAIGWPVFLVPELLDQRLRLPDGSYYLYQSYRWEEGVPAGALTLSVQTEWANIHGDAIDVCVRTLARGERGTATIAEGLAIARVPVGAVSEAVPFGDPLLPRQPKISLPLRSKKKFVISKREVADYGRLTGIASALHQDTSYARSLGYSDVLVQSDVLTLVIMNFAGLESFSGLQAWFLHPVAVGNSLTAAISANSKFHEWVVVQLGSSDPSVLVSFG